MNGNKLVFILTAILVLLFLACQNTFGQQKEETFEAKNTFYAAISYQVPVYSINFDRLFHQATKLIWTYRLGFSLTADDFAFIAGINAITGKNNSHLEPGINLILIFEESNPLLGAKDLFDKKFYLAPSIGYRYQKPAGGLFFRGQVSPSILFDPRASNFWKMDPKLKFIGSLGLGYSF